MTAIGLGYSSIPLRLRYAGAAIGVEEIPEPRVPDTPASPSAPPMRHMPKVEDFLVRLLLYIPGDIVALYLILAGFISGRHSALAWGVFGFCLLCSVWAVLAGYSWAKRRQGAASEPKPWFRICAAPVAFTVWAVSLPDSPFDALWLFGESWVKSSILCCGSLVIGLAAQQFDTSSGR